MPKAEGGPPPRRRGYHAVRKGRCAVVLDRTQIAIDPAWCREGATIPEDVEISEAWYEAFIEANPGYKVELLRNGKVARRMNAYSSSLKHVEFVFLLKQWSNSYGGGVLDSAIEVRPAPRVIRRPDAAWVSPERVPPPDRWDEPLRLAPDFVAEIVSPSQRARLSELDEKMREYIDWGVRLAWLIDPRARLVRIYRADGSIEDLDHPATLSGEDVMPDFTMDMTDIWIDV